VLPAQTGCTQRTICPQINKGRKTMKPVSIPRYNVLNDKPAKTCPNKNRISIFLPSWPSCVVRVFLRARHRSHNKENVVLKRQESAPARWLEAESDQIAEAWAIRNRVFDGKEKSWTDRAAGAASAWQFQDWQYG
jgi:hypothetical protein